MSKKHKYSVDLILRLDLIKADDRDELHEILNKYIDILAKHEELTWGEVDWTVKYVLENTDTEEASV